MNQREAKIHALEIAWMMTDKYYSAFDVLDELPEDSAQKIRAELNKISQRLYERAKKLNEKQRR